MDALLPNALDFVSLSLQLIKLRRWLELARSSGRITPRAPLEVKVCVGPLAPFLLVPSKLAHPCADPLCPLTRAWSSSRLPTPT